MGSAILSRADMEVGSVDPVERIFGKIQSGRLTREGTQPSVKCRANVSPARQARGTTPQHNRSDNLTK